MGAPKRNLNRLTSGRRVDPNRLFEVGGLPAGYGLIIRACRKLRVALEKAVLEARGQISVAAAASIDNAVKAEMASKLAQRWLRLSPEATLEQRLTLVKEIRTAVVQRDQQIAKLQLDDRPYAQSEVDQDNDCDQDPDSDNAPAPESLANPADSWAELDRMERAERDSKAAQPRGTQ